MGLADASSSPGFHLVLGLGVTGAPSKADHNTRPTKSSCNLAPTTSCEPTLTLALSAETQQVLKKVDANRSCEDPLDFSRQTSPHSAVSSFSGGRVKRERDLNNNEEVEAAERVSSRGSNENEDGTSARKKLRLNKEQSALLEESFKQNSTLNPKQKQALARQLNLRPRQVEVWFQNRRARTKLKRTEVDCESLKKCCETLTDENRRLQKEVKELKAMKLAQPMCMAMPATTLTMCPSCERLCGVASDGASNDKTAFSTQHNNRVFPTGHGHCIFWSRDIRLGNRVIS